MPPMYPHQWQLGDDGGGYSGGNWETAITALQRRRGRADVVLPRRLCAGAAVGEADEEIGRS